MMTSELGGSSQYDSSPIREAHNPFNTVVTPRSFLPIHQLAATLSLKDGLEPYIVQIPQTQVYNDGSPIKEESSVRIFYNNPRYSHPDGIGFQKVMYKAFQAYYQAINSKKTDQEAQSEAAEIVREYFNKVDEFQKTQKRERAAKEGLPGFGLPPPKRNKIGRYDTHVDMSKEEWMVQREKVRYGLRLDEVLPHASQEIKDLIVDTITTTLLDTAEILGGLTIPDVEVTEDKSAAEHYEGGKITKAQAKAHCYFSKHHPNGLIKYTGNYLRDLTEYKERKFGSNVVPLIIRWELRNITAHEMYHFRHSRFAPKVSMRKPYPKHPSFEQWAMKRYEYAATIFAKKYVENYNVADWKDKLLKTIFVMDLREQLKMIQKIRLGENKSKQDKTVSLQRIPQAA